MAYNKSKLVANAQKLLHQGKIVQAIQEYLQILKNEPKDQATLMTVGDLYVRQGDTFQALEYFERLAQIYLADGFVTKAIAIYKKIAKLAPEETRPVEKLAELYVQQGVLSEARPIYLELAELHQRAGRQPQAAALLRKLLEAEPDNLRVLTRVAELALAMNQPADAATALRTAAEQMFNQGNHAEAIKYADRVIKIDAKDRHALVIKARALAATGQSSAAVSLLAALPDLDQGGDSAELLIHLYLQSEQTDEAAKLASQIFARSSTNFAPLRQVSAKLLEGKTPETALPLIDSIRAAMIGKGEHEALGLMLTSACERLPDRVEPHEWLVDLYKHTSDSFRLPDALISLAKLCEAAGNHERALQVYEESLDRDPENDAVRRERDRLKAKSAKELPATTAAPAAPQPVQSSLQPEAHEAAPETSVAVPIIDGDTQRFIAQALTDVDLFSSYGLTQKAIDLLEVILERAPGHAQTLERLLDHYLGAGDEARTAKLAAELEGIHTKTGDTAAAERFADLRRRYAHAAQAAQKAIPEKHAQAEQPVPEFSLPADLPPTAAAGAPAEFAVNEPDESPAPVIQESVSSVSQGAAVHELDLSEEWAALATELEASAAESKEPPEAAIESQQPAAPSGQAAPEFNIPAAEIPALADAAAEIEELLKPEPPGPSSNNPIEAPDYVLELQTPEAENGAASSMTANDLLESLSNDLDAALPSLKAELAEQSAENNSHPAKESAKFTAPASSSAPDKQTGPLSEIFDQFRSEVGEVGAEDEDLETHYNLGIAYREMGLIEEAISEFQKVAKGSSKGQAFRYAMQCCTLLGLAFMEQGQPAIAATWYERALAMPGLDQESILALRYDLGVAQELAGDMAAARKSFSQVYGMNIDYRDVAERLSSLGNER